MSKVVLCGRPQGCCPTLEADEYGWEIKDDFGGIVKLTKEEMELLINEVN